MPLPTTQSLFIDVSAGLAYATYSSTSPISNPVFYLGDLAKLRIYFIEQTGLGTYPRQEVAGLGSPGIKVAVGAIDESPTAGHFHLTFGGDTTPNQVFNVTAAALATDLNALASIIAAGGVTVSKEGDNYSIKFVSNGSRAAFTGNGSALIPLSTVGISVLQEGNGSQPEIVLVHLQKNVAALALSFSATTASTITTATLSAWDGSRATYRASISPDPKGGTFTLAFDANTGTDVSTISLAVGSTALEVQNALSKDALLDLVSVQQVGAYAYDITVRVQPGGSGLTGGSSGLLSFAGFEGNLDMNTANAISYLDGAESIQTTLEVEIADGTDTLTVLQIPCTLKSAVIDEGALSLSPLEPALTESSADGRYLRQANNLSELVSTSSARTNLSVYSIAQVDTALALKANTASPTFSGYPQAPTQAASANDTSIASTFYVTRAVAEPNKIKSNIIASEVIAIDRANAAMGFGWGTTIPRMIVNIGVGNWGILNATTSAYNASAVHSGNTVYFTGMSANTAHAFKIRVVDSSGDSVFSVI